MNKRIYDLAIIGAGAGGLSVASVAAQLGFSVILAEKHKMGGDCLNYGCVPSKSLIAVAKAAHNIKSASSLGIECNNVSIDLQATLNHVRHVIHKLEPNDSMERFQKLGVDVRLDEASFIDENQLKIGLDIIKARYFVIATGSRPLIPDIPGLSNIDYLTNETIFSLTETPQHLIVIGGGSIGCELSHAFCLLGIRVTLIEAFTVLPREDQHLSQLLKTKMIQDGVIIHESAKQLVVKKNNREYEVSFQHDSATHTVLGSHLLICTGRKPNIQDLQLHNAKIDYNHKGIMVDQSLRTSNKRVYTIGDATGLYPFTHTASYHAGIVLQNIFFKWPVKAMHQAIPRVTFTVPELAHVGLTESEAKIHSSDVIVLTYPFSECDRAIAENETAGEIKVIVNKKGKILGCSILGKDAGELIVPWVMLIQKNETLKSLSKIIIPYPTLSEIHKKIVSEFYSPLLFSENVRKWLHRLHRLINWINPC